MDVCLLFQARIFASIIRERCRIILKLTYTCQLAHLSCCIPYIPGRMSFSASSADSCWIAFLEFGWVQWYTWDSRWSVRSFLRVALWLMLFGSWCWVDLSLGMFSKFIPSNNFKTITCPKIVEWTIVPFLQNRRRIVGSCSEQLRSPLVQGKRTKYGVRAAVEFRSSGIDRKFLSNGASVQLRVSILQGPKVHRHSSLSRSHYLYHFDDMRLCVGFHGQTGREIAPTRRGTGATGR